MPSEAKAWVNEEAVQTASNAGTPSWIAPRRVSVTPFAFPRATQPPLITNGLMNGIASTPVRSSRPPEPAIPAAMTATVTALRSAPPSFRPPAYPDLREENASLKAQLAQATVMLSQLRHEALATCEPDLVRLACAIAERVVGRELEADPALVVTWAREGLAALASRDGLVVAIAPDIAEHVGEDAWKKLGAPHALQIDEALAPSTCELRTASASVSLAADARMDLVTSELGVTK